MPYNRYSGLFHDIDVDYTGIYNTVFEKNVNFILSKDALDEYINLLLMEKKR